MTAYARFRRQEEIGFITIDHPPVNALRREVPPAIEAALMEGENDPAVRVMIVHGAGRVFVAGADLHEIQAAASGFDVAQWLLPLLLRIEDCAKPVIMAIHGAALGGGLELAMAGHYRVASAAAQLGMPEVTLGLIPGWGGTQRLPRLTGFPKALEMCRTGLPVTACQAAADGLIDRVIDGDLLTGAEQFAREVLSAGGPRRKTREQSNHLGEASSLLFANAREAAAQEHPDERAPLAVIEAIEAAVALPFEEACRRETELFAEALASAEARARIQLFFSKREQRKPTGSTPG